MQSQPCRGIDSRPIFGFHSFTGFTALAIVRLCLSAMPETTVHFAHSVLSIPTTNHNRRAIMKTRRQAFTCLSGITLVLVLSLASVPALWADSQKVAASPPPSMAAIQAAYGHL